MIKNISTFGNKKLEKIFPLLIAQMASKFTVYMRQLGENRSEQVRFNRFINNPKVSPEKLVSFHWQQLDADFSGQHLLIIGDTTTLSFADRADREYLGYLDKKTDKSGFNVHSAMVVDARDGGSYGLGGIKMIRNLNPKGKSKVKTKSYSADKFEQTERYKWIEVAQSAVDHCKNADSYTLIGDREADIYALIAGTVTKDWQFVFRCRCNRNLSNGKLYQTIDSWPVEHQYSFEVSPTKKRSKHTARVDVKYGSVTLPRPERHPDKELVDQVAVNVIEIKEQAQTVIEGEPAVHWRILTSHPVDTLEQVMQIIQWYQWRWNIEQAFRTLKLRGLDVERSELESYHGLANLATLALITAMQVMQLVQARDGQTQQKIEQVFSPTEKQCMILLKKKFEGKTQKQKNHHPPDSLAFASWIIARLGGWKGYQKERPPGPITMINGLIRFNSMVEGFTLLNEFT